MVQHNGNLKSKIDYNPSHIGQKVCELSSTNRNVIAVNVDPPKWTFSGDYNSSSNFYKVLEIEQSLLAHTANWNGVPQSFKCGLATLPSVGAVP